MINKEGETLEIKNNNPNSELVENKLVKKICGILEDENSIFNMEKFKKIKEALKYHGKYYENPVVFKTGKYKGETADNDDKKEYKNNIIKQIINEIRDFLEDEYFNVDKIFASSGNDNNSQERLTLNENNINSTNRINHETQA
jgi:predicted house-cleaning noncanonical NTP pyrophosphatase (MazG superfamily)